ncbi:MAG: hypothetical protein Q4E53_05020 [Eubacteriales bacterium]|nr:hypothetical protein [Eubacteriales bacterium]
MATFLQILHYFLIYAFLGWVVEVVYHVVCQGVIVNRGFLNGPLCPIYGFGMLLCLGLLLPLSDNLLILFLGGMFLTTSIELFGGWILEKLFHMRWWDYSDQPYNLHGYICPKFSLAWGVGVVFAVRIVHTIVYDISQLIFALHLQIFLIPVFVLFFIDLAGTIASILKLQNELKHLSHLTREVRAFSDNLTDVIANKTLDTEQKIDASRVQVALGRAEGKEYINRRRQELEKEILDRKSKIQQIGAKMHAHKFFGYGRILEAYPHMKLGKTGVNLKETVDMLTEAFEKMNF